MVVVFSRDFFTGQKPRDVPAAYSNTKALGRVLSMRPAAYRHN